MVICTMGKLDQPGGWNSKRCELNGFELSPKHRLTYDHPQWNERRIETSLLQSPAIIVRALGASNARRIVALRQVDEVDLYLRVDDKLHLLEVKGLKGRGNAPYRKWQSALAQIVKYWSSRHAWLTGDARSVRLWALCPIRWDEQGPRVPTGWESEIAKLQTSDPSLPPLGLVFYSLFQHAGERVMLIWRADETTPSIRVGC